MRLTAFSALLGLAALGGCPIGPTNDGDSSPTARQKLTVAAAGPATASVGETIELTSSVTDAAAVGPYSYGWLQISGPPIALSNTDAATATFVTPSIGTPKLAEFMVTVSDSRGAVGAAQVTLIVNADPQFEFPEPDAGATLPFARAGADREYAPGDPVELDGSESSGTELTFSWSQVQGPDLTLTNPDEPIASFTAPPLGGFNTYAFELTVTDAFGRVARDAVVIEIIGRPQVRVETSLGNFTVELEPGLAPITVDNFLQYVDDDFYDGTIFHRVIPEFVIQGGGFEPGLNQKETRDPIELEADNGLSNTRGTIAMARTSDPDSATAQFYVNLVDNSGDLDPSDSNPGYTVFGEVISGLDVVDTIAAVDTESTGGFDDVPVDDVVIERIVRVN